MLFLQLTGVLAHLSQRSPLQIGADLWTLVHRGGQVDVDAKAKR